MARPSKPTNVIAMEKKSHRTKAELEQREKHEAALLTGESIVETAAVRDDPIAHVLFLRIRKLLRKIGKADAMYEQIVNRYALILAECIDFEKKREAFSERARALDQMFDEQDATEPNAMQATDYFRLSVQLQGQVVALDKQVQAKRRMALDIEKECAMTIAAALRAVPKQVEDETADDPLTKLLQSRYG